jgi:membrane associated rhomboid family serine protease
MTYREFNQINPFNRITPAVRFIIMLNVGIFLIESLFRIPFTNWFVLHAQWYETLRFGQLFTYMFVHGGGMHLFMNMLMLFFIGPTVEQSLGSYKFFVLYYLSGILGGLGWSLLAAPGTSCIGASGATMGVLGAFAALYPNAKLYLYMLVPIRAWLLVLIISLWELSEMIGQPKIGGIANAAHLMGGIGGFMYAFSFKHPHIVQELKARFSPDRPAGASDEYSRRRTHDFTQPPHAIPPEVMDRILDKIGKEGMGALTPQERDMLKRGVRR